MTDTAARRPNTIVERDLASAQRLVTKGMLADRKRRELIAQLYAGGMTQTEIAARLTEVSEREGGPPVGVDAVQKMLKRRRMALARERNRSKR